MSGRARSNTAEYVIALAEQNGIHYLPTPEDELAEVATRLAGDDVVTDEIEDLIMALRRAGMISGTELVRLLGQYLKETH